MTKDSGDWVRRTPARGKLVGEPAPVRWVCYEAVTLGSTTSISSQS